MRIGYMKLAKSMPLVPSRTDSDDEPVRLLRDLAARRPADTFVILGRNSAQSNAEAQLPLNVENPWLGWNDELKAVIKATGEKGPMSTAAQDQVIAWGDAVILPEYRRCDAVIGWLGDHGNVNSRVPATNGSWSDPKPVKTYDQWVVHGSHIVRGVNAFRSADPLTREEIWLDPDARTYLKPHDLKWPLKQPILGQFVWTRKAKFERYGDMRSPEECGFPEASWDNDHIWVAETSYVYSRLEVSGIMPWHVDVRYSDDFDRRHFGLFINEGGTRSYANKPGTSRLDAMREYILPMQPAFLHGKWTDKSLAKLGVQIAQAPAEEYYDLLRSVRTTFTAPSNGSGWATTKPWQAFAVGTVCFFHPQYDTQNHILKDAHPELARWLRVESPGQLRRRVDHLQSDRDTWLWLIQTQRAHYDKAVAEQQHIRMIEERLMKQASA